ncbi:response regulator transcription factor [Pleurocapsa sp. FMAR1]|uniref:response regulator transcription factor n=1 Tax=Pleurocapsa sp. FMAR1 TaxID=3040204 RepID=UPI0029C94E0E|nr:response regulator [Pleurocapsa sp. FMAR1]
MSKVLVIEDEAQTREIFLDCLEAEGFEGIEAKNGRIGVEKAREQSPDLVVCDILLPELNGYEVLKTLRQNPITATIPFIFLTGKAGKAELRQGMQMGADDYLTKPSTAEEFLDAIATQLAKREALKQLYAAQFQQLTSEVEADSNSILPSTPNPQLQEIFDYIEAHYHESISLIDVATSVGYSSAYLTDLVKRQTGTSINRWIIKRRLAAAEALLQETNYSIEQIAEEIGYLNPGHFFRQFRKYVGTTPKVWRKAHRGY